MFSISPALRHVHSSLQTPPLPRSHSKRSKDQPKPQAHVPRGYRNPSPSSSNQKVNPSSRLHGQPPPQQSFNAQHHRQHSGQKQHKPMTAEDVAHIRKSARYKAAYRKWLAILLGVPILLATSWAMMQRCEFWMCLQDDILLLVFVRGWFELIVQSAGECY